MFTLLFVYEATLFRHRMRKKGAAAKLAALSSDLVLLSLSLTEQPQKERTPPTLLLSLSETFFSAHIVILAAQRATSLEK